MNIKHQRYFFLAFLCIFASIPHFFITEIGKLFVLVIITAFITICYFSINTFKTLIEKRKRIHQLGNDCEKQIIKKQIL